MALPQSLIRYAAGMLIVLIRRLRAACYYADTPRLRCFRFFA